jgi:hypothetical protein
MYPIAEHKIPKNNNEKITLGCNQDSNIISESIFKNSKTANGAKKIAP